MTKIPLFTKQIEQAVIILQQGGLIAYPTEAVFGLGCLPQHEITIQRLLKLKQRPQEKGLILLGSNLLQLETYISPLNQNILRKIQTIQTTPTTWLLPTPKTTSILLKGRFNKIAIRISQHPIIQQLCQQCQSPIISTSANISGQAMSYSATDVTDHFQQQLDYIIDAPLGESQHPSIIKDAISDQIIRE
jgi:L-threonylcarbamoyladenylate synthase